MFRIENEKFPEFFFLFATSPNKVIYFESWKISRKKFVSNQIKNSKNVSNHKKKSSQKKKFNSTQKNYKHKIISKWKKNHFLNYSDTFFFSILTNKSYFFGRENYREEYFLKKRMKWGLHPLNLPPPFPRFLS